ncbi:MAG TPA: hypothetical protein VF691_15510 [Cytophagaceae bacterium]|jgi:hypothetical protein
MKSVLFYKEIVENDYSFQNELLEWIRATFPNIDALDADSLTDSSLFDLVLPVINQSDLAVIILDCKYQSPLSNLMPLMEEIWKRPDKYYILVVGENVLAKKMVKLCKHVYFNLNFEEQKELVNSLLNEE